MRSGLFHAVSLHDHPRFSTRNQPQPRTVGQASLLSRVNSFCRLLQVSLQKPAKKPSNASNSSIAPVALIAPSSQVNSSSGCNSSNSSSGFDSFNSCSSLNVQELIAAGFPSPREGFFLLQGRVVHVATRSIRKYAVHVVVHSIQLYMSFLVQKLSFANGWETIECSCHQPHESACMLMSTPPARCGCARACTPHTVISWYTTYPERRDWELTIGVLASPIILPRCGCARMGIHVNVLPLSCG